MRGGWGDVGLGWSVFEPSAQRSADLAAAAAGFFPEWLGGETPGGTDQCLRPTGSTSLTTSDDDNCDRPFGWGVVRMPRNVLGVDAI